MTTKFFNAVKQCKKIGGGTVGNLIDWLEQFINVTFPENGIEYWSHGDLSRRSAVPDNRSDIHHIGCYVMDGNNEGYRIEVLLSLRNNSYKLLASIKTFGSEDESWLVARAITAALESIFAYEQVPEIVDMSLKVPRQYQSCRTTNLREEVVITATLNSIRVASSGVILDEREFSQHGSNAGFYVESRVKDWQTVLKNVKANFKTKVYNSISIPDLPGTSSMIAA